MSIEEVPYDDLKYVNKVKPSKPRKVMYVEVECSNPKCKNIEKVPDYLAPEQDSELSQRYFCKDCLGKRFD